jgi:hypothetical protein
MSYRYRFVLAAAIVVALTGLPACYTIMKHPQLASLDYARPDDRNCTNCHSEQEIWGFNHTPTKPTYQSYSRAWIKYYDTAWWYEGMWDYHPDLDKVTSQTEKTSNDAR